jgi:hypothetical protein
MLYHKGQLLEIFAQIIPTFTARQNILQTQNKVAIVFLVFRLGIHWIIETNGVEQMPRTVAPNGCQEPVITIIIIFRKNVFPGFGHFSLSLYTQ